MEKISSETKITTSYSSQENNFAIIYMLQCELWQFNPSSNNYPTVEQLKKNAQCLSVVK